MSNACHQQPPKQLRLVFRRTAGRQLAAGTIRTRYDRAPWTAKGCAICGDPRYQLHHIAYDRSDIDEMLLVVALCPSHHQDLSLNLWPHMRHSFTREHATLLYIVHGGRLHQHWTETPNRIRIGVSPHQEALPL
jgi:hypothetical protein